MKGIGISKVHEKKPELALFCRRRAITSFESSRIRKSFSFRGAASVFSVPSCPGQIGRLLHSRVWGGAAKVRSCGHRVRAIGGAAMRTTSFNPGAVGWSSLRAGFTGLMFCLTASAFSAPVLAQSGQGAGRDACKADAGRLCSSVQRGEGRVQKCLADNKSQLSEQCRRAVDRAGDRHRRGDSKN